MMANERETEIMENALRDIASAHVPDQPATSQADEVSWVMRHVGAIRQIAKKALDSLDRADTMDKATEIPMSVCGASINCGRDGVWLHLSSSTGLYLSLNMNDLANKPGAIDRDIRDWCIDRQTQAALIRGD